MPVAKKCREEQRNLEEKMHEYLMEIDHYFGSPKRFQVLADNKEQAIEKAKET